MTTHPIIFSAPMVRALLSGRKTQTRRIIKDRGALPQYCGGRHDSRDAPENWGFEWHDHGSWITLDQWRTWRFVPFSVGDRLWVREAFAISGIGWGKRPSEAIGGKVHYREDPDHGWQSYWGSWRPSIHMPRWASRLTLTVTDVRVQRLQDISEADAMAEGIEDGGCTQCGGSSLAPEGCCYDPSPDFVDSFAWLWNNLHGPEAWYANPWVAAYTFTVHRCNIDQMEASA